MAKRALGCLIFLVLTGLAGTYIGMQTADRKLSGQSNPWISMPLPDGATPANFIEGVGSIAYIRSTDGRLFFQELEAYRDPPIWQEIDRTIAEEDLDNRIASGNCTPVPVSPHSLWGEKPPSGSIAQINCLHHVNPEHLVSAMYVILEQGDVRRWIRDDPGLGSLGIYLIYMGFGAFVGAALGLLLYGVLLLIRGRGEVERRSYLAGEIDRDVVQPSPSDVTIDLLDRLDDQD